MVADGDALAQLAQAVIVQPGPQLRLAEQNDLQQLAVVRLQVRKQPHLFQQLVGQVLRFVNDQHRFLAALDLLEQELVDDRQGIQPVQAVHRQTELLAIAFTNSPALMIGFRIKAVA